MIETLTPPGERLHPSRERVLRALGYPASHRIPDRVLEVLDQAYQQYRRTSRPRALILKIPPDDLVPMLGSEHRTHPDIPLDLILPRADHTLLFAFTLGPSIGRLIGELFETGRYTTATLLDRIASEATDRAARWVESRMEAEYKSRTRSVIPVRFVLYSPGYCGWKLSAQAPLFRFLKPEKIGIRLNNRYLMTPLKSVTGVLAGGGPVIHRFPPRYPFCEECRDKTCRPRQSSVSRNQDQTEDLNGNFGKNISIPAKGR